jgi:photosystem II stability/assembly factor-like uncharacterized protein
MIKNFQISIVLCLLALSFNTTQMYAQKKLSQQFLDNKIESKRAQSLESDEKKADIDDAQKAAEEHPWLRKPYLNTSPEKATLTDLMMASKAWQKKNGAKNVRLKDDEFARFQRKLYQWERESGLNEAPADANMRMDAYTDYVKEKASQLKTRGANVDANWKLLGPITNPSDNPYYLEGYPDADLGNAGLGRINCIEFSNWDANNLWVGTSSAGVWKSWDGGKNWWNISMNLPITEISDIAIDQSNSNIIYVATGDRDLRSYGSAYNNIVGRLYKTTDGGETWQRINANFGNGTFIEGLYTHPTRTNEVVVMRTNGMYKSVDGGTTWSKTLTINADSESYLTNAYANKANNGRIYLLTDEFTANSYTVWLSRSDDFGSTWQRMESIKSTITSPDFLSTVFKMSVAPSDQNCVYIAALEYDTTFQTQRFGAIVRTLDGGKTWENKSRFPSVPNVLGWFLGDSTDIGSQIDYNLVLAIDPKNKDKIFLSGVSMWGSEDAGKSFSKTTFWIDAMGESAHADHHWGEYSPVTGEFFLATDGGLYKTKNLTTGDQKAIEGCFDYSLWNAFKTDCYTLPTKWEYAGNGIANNEFYAIAVSKSNPDMVIGGTQDNGTFMQKDGKWSAIFGGDGFVPLIHPTNTNIFYSSIYYGQLFKTTDGGKNYKHITLAMDTLDQGAWLTPMVLVENSPNILIQAREKNVWRTTNAGNTWKAISDFPQGKAFNFTLCMEIAPSNGNIIYTAKVTGDGGGLPPNRIFYKTTDGGTTWANIWHKDFPIANMTDIAIHPTNPNKIWVTFSAGFSATNPNQAKKVFYSEDAGITWTNITLGLPTVPIWTIAVSAESYDDAIYVGTGVGVFYRDNKTGKFIEYQNTQMPKGTIVTDLKIHAASRRIYAGTYGHGIWRADLFDNPQYVYSLTAPKVDRNIFLSVYPNPSTGMVKVVWDNEKIPIESLKITDLMGRTVHNDSQFKDKSYVDMSALPTGVYVIQLKTDVETIAKKIVIER